MTFSYWLGYHFFKLTARSLFNWRVIGRENLDVPGGAVVVGNHASFVDPPYIGIAFDDAIHYLARKTLFDHPVAGAIFRSWSAIPVDQERPDPVSLKAVIRCLRKGDKVLLFPEGNRAPDGIIQEALPGTGFVVAKSRVPVIPVRIFGSFEALPRHASLPRPAEITIVVGKTWHYDPARYQETGKELYQKISDELIAEISRLHL